MSETSRLQKLRQKIEELYEQELQQQQNTEFRSQFIERAWLKNRGKQQCISFSDKALVELHKYFNSLDQKGTGSIGVDELQDPFIAFGLSDTREQVVQLIKTVDLDGSGTIQFNEFLDIMLKIKRGKSSKGSNKNTAMYDFFSKMSTGKLGEDFDQDMSFKLNVSQFRRKKLLESIMSSQKEKKEKGARILQNFKKQVINNPYWRQTLNQSKKETSMLYGLDPKLIKKLN